MGLPGWTKCRVVLLRALQKKYRRLFWGANEGKTLQQAFRNLLGHVRTMAAWESPGLPKRASRDGLRLLKSPG